MVVNLAEPSATLNIVMSPYELGRLIEKGRITFDIHRYCLSGYIQFITIRVENEKENPNVNH